MRAKLVQRKQNIAVVVVTDKSNYKRAYLIPASIVNSVKKDQEFNISQDVISTGTEFSIDWDIIIPRGFRITSRDIQNAFVDRGIYSLEDYRNNPKAANEAINVFVGKLRMQLAQKVNEMLGG